MCENNILKNTKGFTFLEISLVVFIVAIIFAGIFVSLSPAENLSNARDDVRRTDAKVILESIINYQFENDGAIMAGVNSTLTMIGTDTSSCDVSCASFTTASSCIDLKSDLSPYMVDMPVDPKLGNSSATYYAVKYDNALVTVVACAAENGDIELSM